MHSIELCLSKISLSPVFWIVPNFFFSTLVFPLFEVLDFQLDDLPYLQQGSHVYNTYKI